MENWDEKKLEEVVNKKHGEAEKKKPKTQIVCPFLALSGFIFRDSHVVIHYVTGSFHKDAGGGLRFGSGHV